MSTYKRLIELVSRKKAPQPSREFWQEFDKELGQKLDAINAKRSRQPVPFIDAIRDFLGTLLKPSLRPVVAGVFLIIIAMGGSILFKNYQDIQFYSVSALSNEELADELSAIEELTFLIDSLP